MERQSLPDGTDRGFRDREEDQDRLVGARLRERPEVGAEAGDRHCGHSFVGRPLDCAGIELGENSGAARDFLGPATDGGWWALGLRRPTPAAVLGVPMSTGATGRHQRDRLRSLGWTIGALPVLRDVDHWEDALSVPVHPSSAFAAAVASVQAALPAFVP